MTQDTQRKVAVVTGGSAGIGEATAEALAKDGWHVVVAARRADKVEEIAQRIGGTGVQLDVTDEDSVKSFVEKLDRVDLLVNNAGGAKGLEPLEETTIEDWRWMYETNVIGTVRMTQALLPKLRESGNGLIINIGSVAGWNPYEGGSGYNAAKFGLRALTRVTRIEQSQNPIRVTEIDPGRVATDFSMNRFKGDKQRADAVYDGQMNLTAEDIAEAVRWVASLPAHVDIDTMTIKPRTQL